MVESTNRFFFFFPILRLTSDGIIAAIRQQPVQGRGAQSANLLRQLRTESEGVLRVHGW